MCSTFTPDITHQRQGWDHMRGRRRPKIKGESSLVLARNGSPSWFPASNPNLYGHIENQKWCSTRKEDSISTSWMGFGYEKKCLGMYTRATSRGAIVKKFPINPSASNNWSSSRVVYIRIENSNINRGRIYQTPRHRWQNLPRPIWPTDPIDHPHPYSSVPYP